MSDYREPDRNDVVQALLYLAAYVAALVAGAFFLMPKYWYLMLIIVLGCFLLLVRWQTRAFGYECESCGSRFDISLAANLTAVNWGTRRYLRCPECGRRRWVRTLAKNGSRDRGTGEGR